MWRSVTSSDRVRAGVLAAVALLAAAAAGPAAGKVLMSADEALALAYPGCEVERDTVYLTAEERRVAERRADVPVPSAIVRPYRVRCDGEPGGTAYFDVHRVRTLEETLMVALGADGAVKRIEVLSFREPMEYLPREIWYEQFLGRELDEELRVKAEIHNVTGATLTARATTEAVRRVLALHGVVEGSGQGAGSGAQPAGGGEE